MLLPGTVLVAPPGQHLPISADSDGVSTHLIISGAYTPSRPSADLLLATLATAVHERAVAVILSGSGHDGATGATAVHTCGGTVLATDEASSSTYAMPLAAIQRDEAVDEVLPLDQIAARLQTLFGDSRSLTT
jgi:two-component system chemotaxis response regulator CheB